MASEDPAALLLNLCRISSSQEDHLSRCKFAFEPDDESSDDHDDFDDIPVASTGIIMVSPPDTLEDQEYLFVPRDNDVFHTPPEEPAMESSQEHQQMVSADSGEDRAVEGVANNRNSAAVDGGCTDLRIVDLGRDTDLGFSAEAELTERIAIDSNLLSSPGVNQVKENEVIHRESINSRVRERELGAGDGLYESPQKKMKIVSENFGLPTPEPCLGSEAAKTLERVAKSIEKLKYPLKNSNTLNENVMLETSGDASGVKKGKMEETVQNWSFEGINLLESSESVQNHQIEEVHGGDGEFQGTSSARRKLDFPSEASEPELVVEGNALVSMFNESRVESESETIEDDIADGSCDAGESFSHERPKYRKAKSIDDKFRYVGSAGANSSKKHKDTKQKHVLPMSLQANNGEAVGEAMPVESSCTSDDKEVKMSFSTNNGEGTGEVVPDEVSSTRNDQAVRQGTVFNVLRELAKQFPYDPCVETLSVVDVMKLRGVTFP